MVSALLDQRLKLQFPGTRHLVHQLSVRAIGDRHWLAGISLRVEALRLETDKHVLTCRRMPELQIDVAARGRLIWIFDHQLGPGERGKRSSEDVGERLFSEPTLLQPRLLIQERADENRKGGSEVADRS